MTFDVAADSYDRFMGRYARELGRAQVDLLDLQSSMRVLDVGAGTGALTELLVARQGGGLVTAAEPSEPFVRALRIRLPGVAVHRASTDSLPFPDGAFARTVAQLVVNFITDPVAGLREMARVTAPDGLVACSVWDFAGGRAPMSPYWAAAREVDPETRDESESVGGADGALDALLTAAGLTDVSGHAVTVEVPYDGPEAWWAPFELGVGPAGAHLASVDRATHDEIRIRTIARLPRTRGVLQATAWTASGRVSDPTA